MSDSINKNNSENCNRDCGSCSADCASRENPQIEKEEENPYSHIKKIIAVISGKGGVGKSSVTAGLAVATKRLGYKTAIMDADITGPSIPKIFGIYDEPEVSGDSIIAPETGTGIRLMSLNLLIDDETAPVIWRGPVIAGTVKQFYSDVVWGDIDYMFVDCPPGTGDVPLTIFQSLPVDGVVIVTTPGELVSMIVEKALRMADDMDVPILGIVENMSYYKCPDCGGIHNIFGESRISDIMYRFGIKTGARLPIDIEQAKLMDKGRAEDIRDNKLKDFAKQIISGLESSVNKEGK